MVPFLSLKMLQKLVEISSEAQIWWGVLLFNTATIAVGVKHLACDVTKSNVQNEAWRAPFLCGRPKNENQLQNLGKIEEKIIVGTVIRYIEKQIFSPKIDV